VLLLNLLPNSIQIMCISTSISTNINTNRETIRQTDSS